MKIYKVGGCIRDHFLGIASNDIDYVVEDATHDEMIKLGYSQVGSDFPVYLHPETKAEYALTRSERKLAVGHCGFECTTNVSIHDDLLRRDFTMNAIAFDGVSYIDPFDGIWDIACRIIQHVSPAFQEDPLRVLRAARFAVTLNFGIHPETHKVMCMMVDRGDLNYLTPERVLMEMRKAFKSTNPSRFFRILDEVGALKVVLPEIHSLIAIEQHPEYHPEGNVFEHTMLALDHARTMTDDFDTLMSVLLHDIGKTVDSIAHEKHGLELIEKFADRIKLSSNGKKLALRVCRYHMYAHKLLELKPKTIIDMLQSMNAMHSSDMLNKFIIACQADKHGRYQLENEIYYLRKCIERLKSLRFDDLKNVNSIIQRKVCEIAALRQTATTNRGIDFLKQTDLIKQRFSKEHPDKTLIFLMVAGSHFFDMDTPNSDIDIRGLFYCKDKSCKQIRWKTAGETTRNTKDDVDIDLYSFDRYLELLKSTEFNMLEMLYTPNEKILITSPLYKWIRSIRDNLTTRNVGSFIGFIRREFVHSNIQSDFYHHQVAFLEIAKKWHPHDRVLDHWDEIESYSKNPDSGVKLTLSRTSQYTSVKSFVVGSRLFQGTIAVRYLIDQLEYKIAQYGDRAKNRSGGIDYKSLYHIVRLIEEAKYLTEFGTLKFPFPQHIRNKLWKIKNGDIDIEKLANQIDLDIQKLKTYDYKDEDKIAYVSDLIRRIQMQVDAESELDQIFKELK